MIPPFIRRCPDCGHVSLSRRFAAVSGADRRLVECPNCGAQFAPTDNPLLN